ncbi:abortive infection family protein [Legionella sainthelensi]|uniref:abortive infection family protein n=1 Tax=Legionella sainthelensi TaxID=28087 RepID=UPI000E208A6B|nr:abortive infection family protein [Legionella sainthelensi]
MNTKIPQPIISILSEYLSIIETHASINNLFMYADAPGEPPEGSKPSKVQQWLRRINNESDSPLTILGKLIENYMDLDVEEFLELGTVFSVEPPQNPKKILKEKLINQLEKSNLTYITGGLVHDGKSAPSKHLWEIVKTRDIPSIEEEFHRALNNIYTEPREAVSAACNILESLFKVYIQDEQLEMPSKQDLQGLWKVVVDRLGFDPKSIEDDDLRKVLSGLFSVVNGIGAFRTHASSAHSAGRKFYRLKPRHARVTINSAHTLALFIIETWDEKVKIHSTHT